MITDAKPTEDGLKTHLELDFLSFADRLKIQYEYARRGDSGWSDGIIVDLDDAKLIIAARDTARAAGNRRLDEKRARAARLQS